MQVPRYDRRLARVCAHHVYVPAGVSELHWLAQDQEDGGQRWALHCVSLGGSGRNDAADLSNARRAVRDGASALQLVCLILLICFALIRSVSF